MEIRLEDLNHIIKLFSYHLQDRIDELDGSKNTAVYKRSQLEEGEQEVLQRYNGYKIESLKEIKYAQKFCQRVLQIFSYFRSKSRNSGLLSSQEDRIISEMDAILTRHPIALDALLSFVVGFVRKPFLAERRRVKPTQIIFASAVPQPPKEISTRTKPLSISEHKSKLVASTSQNNLIRSEMRKSVGGANQRKLRPSDNEMCRLYGQLYLDRSYLMRITNQLSLLQREAADKLYRDMLRRNERIQVEIQVYARKPCSKPENLRSQSNINTSGDEKCQSNNEAKILRQAKKHINLSETPTKNVSVFSKQKTLSNQRRQVPDTIFNNWLPRRDSRKAVLERDESLIEANYNFCLKESNKLQQHRRLRKPQQQNELQEYVPHQQNKSMHESYGNKVGVAASTVDQLVRLMV